MNNLTVFSNKVTGIVSYVAEYIDGLPLQSEYNYQVFEDIDIVSLGNLTDYYVKNQSLVKLPEKPSKYHIWNLETEQWQEPENYQQLLFNEAADKVKKERQRLLTATDWTDTVSASTRLENYNAWQFYRQQLRDITTQAGYPLDVIWPTQP